MAFDNINSRISADELSRAESGAASGLRPTRVVRAEVESVEESVPA